VYALADNLLPECSAVVVRSSRLSCLAAVPARFVVVGNILVGSLALPPAYFAVVGILVGCLALATLHLGQAYSIRADCLVVQLGPAVRRRRGAAGLRSVLAELSRRDVVSGRCILRMVVVGKAACLGHWPLIPSSQRREGWAESGRS
jgi:hypothetical protein